MKIPRSIVKDILKLAKNEAPLEACGYLAGKDELVDEFYPMTNVDRSPVHYSFDPDEQFAVLKRARAKGQELIAVFHSHPTTPARPSEEDIRLAYDPCISYIIVSLIENPPVVKSFKIKAGTVNQEKLEFI